MDYTSRSFNENFYPRLASFGEGGLSPTPDYLQHFSSFASPNLDYSSTLARTKFIRSPETKVETAQLSPSMFYRPLFLTENHPPRVSDFQMHPVYCSPSSAATSKLELSLESAKHKETCVSSKPSHPDGSTLSKSCVSEKHSTPFLTLSDILSDSLLVGADFCVELEETLAQTVDDQALNDSSSRISIYPPSCSNYRRFPYSYESSSGSVVISDVLLADAAFGRNDSVASVKPRENMECEEPIFVRPQDVMGEQPSVDDLHIKSEDPDDGELESMEFIYPHQSIASLKTSHTLEDSQIPTLTNDQLCEVVDYFFQHIHVPKPEEIVQSAIPRTTALGDLYNPIYQDISISEEKQVKTEASWPSSQAGQETVCARTVLADRTNGSRTRPLHNVLDDFDTVIPFDINLSRAFEGVSHETVAQKTKHYRMMNPGQKLSDDLLFSFAGRLSEYGETILGYRCYISGCRKTTKRKDHMGDHIRTHLGEKPFQCSICGLGFIRNNDCQRHENNHRPEKKFICDCQAAFSRRDLFVRHQKTACQLQVKKIGCTRRQRSKARQGTPDGDAPDDFDYVPGSAISSWRRRV